MRAICCPCVVYTSQSEQISRRQSVCLIFETHLYICFLIGVLKCTSFPMYELHVFSLKVTVCAFYV